MRYSVTYVERREFNFCLECPAGDVEAVESAVMSAGEDGLFERRLIVPAEEARAVILSEPFPDEEPTYRLKKGGKVEKI